MTSSIALMISTKPRNGEIITNASGSSSVDLVLWACTSSTTNGTITTNRTGGTMSKKSLTFYHYEDHPYQFNHTDALFQRLHPIKLVHVTVDGTSGGGNSFSGNKKKSKTDSANLVNPTVKRLLSFLKEKCSNNTVDTNDDNMLAQPATLEKVVFENDSIMSSSVDFPRLSTIVQQLLGIDSSSTSDMIDSNIGCKNDDDANVNDRKRAAFLQFTGNTYMQQHPIVARCLQFYFHIVENSWPNCTDDNLLGSYEAVGIHGHLSSHLILDSTAADAIHLWPPSNMGQWTVTGGTKSNNSIAGIVTSNACTSSGKRLLTQWLRQPLIDLVELQLRQDAVHELVQRSVGRDSIRDAGLKLFGSPSHDLIRLASNLKKYETLDVAQEVDSNIEGIEESNAKTNQLSSTGNVRKALLSLYHLYLVSREKIPRLVEQLEMALLDDRNCCSSNILMKDCYEQLKICCTELTKSIDLCEAVLDMEAAPQDFFVRRDYKDELVDICTELDQFQSDLEACHADMNEQWANVSGTSSMNQVRLETTSNETYGDELKYQFRLPNTNDSKTLESSFGSKIRVHRILKNGVYFSTSELRKLSSQKVQLIAEYDRHQTEIVSQAMSVAATYVDVLHRADAAIGLLDAISALAHLASYSPHGYCRPILTDTSDDDSGSIELVQARHPCVELQENIEFIPNDIKLVFGQSSFLLVTGPNMGGKSTYIRALGAIVALAQIGSYVPCKYAKINICHHILTRVGAGDLQERGISTFMAEMLESSSILRTATKRSLIIIDELGRGTSTFDGYGLARAISEYIIQKIGCMTVFATHFHELTALEEKEKSVKNCHVTAQKGQNGLTFLYEVRPGPCLESFGIQVAEMAHVPSVVIKEAKRRAKELENFEYRTAQKKSKFVEMQQQPELKENGLVDGRQDKLASNVSEWLDKFKQLPITDILNNKQTTDNEKRQTMMQLLQLN